MAAHELFLNTLKVGPMGVRTAHMIPPSTLMTSHVLPDVPVLSRAVLCAGSRGHRARRGLEP